MSRAGILNRSAGEPPRLIPATLFLVADLPQSTFGPAAVHRIPFAIEALAQFSGFAAQPLAAIPEPGTIAFLILRPAAIAPFGSRAARSEIAGQRAIHVADVADAAIDPGEGRLLFPSIGTPASGE